MSLESYSEEIKAYLEGAKHHQSPAQRWVAASIEEIYFKEGMAGTTVEGNPSDDRNPLALRVIAILDDDVAGASLPMPWRPDLDEIVLAKRLRREVLALRPSVIQDSATLEGAKRFVLAERRQVLAALHVCQTADGEFVEVLYPKTHMELVRAATGLLGYQISDSDSRDVAFEIAVNFLQTVPFTNAKPIFLNEELT